MRQTAFVFAVVMTMALQATAPAKAQPAASDGVREANMSTLGIAAGRTEGAPLRFASELARVLDDGNDMRLLPIVTRGPFENIKDLLFLRGVDMAIVYGDVLNHYKAHPPLPDFESRINYIAHLFPSELHIFARPEIMRLEDLAGKPVNFNTKGTAAAYTGPIVLERLGIKVDARFDPHPVAMGEMERSDKYAATVWVSTKPLDPFLKRQWPTGFKFLPVPLTPALEQYYLPALLETADYPRLIPAGQSVPTLSVPAVLAVYAWPGTGDRYRRVERFIDYFVERLPQLQKTAGFHTTWKDINLAANVPGWRRFPAMQAKLDAIAGKEALAGKPSGAVQLVTGSVRAEPSGAAGQAGEAEATARSALVRAGFQQIGPLRQDERSFWLGTAIRGGERMHVAVDPRGVTYVRRAARQ